MPNLSLPLPEGGDADFPTIMLFCSDFPRIMLSCESDDGVVAVGLTRIEAVSLSDKPPLSVTVSLKTTSLPACSLPEGEFDGAVKLVLASLGLLSCTGGPLS